MVIQRWQSVLLLCAVICMACFTFLSLGQLQSPEYTLNFTTLGFTYEGSNAPAHYAASTWILFVISLLSAVLPFITIFLFKNLALQKRLCLIESLILVAVIIVGAVYGYHAPYEGTVSWSSLACAPFISLIAIAMAYQGISKDARLLRDSERLR